MNNPPKLILKFFRWFCHPDLVTYIEGDLIELFEERTKAKGVRKAKWLFVWDVVKLFRPGIIKRIEGQHHLNQYGMLKNNFKIAIRHFGREKLFTAINLSGLTLGLLCSLIIAVIILFEYSYDNFHLKGDRIYRVLEGDPKSPISEYGTAVPQGIKAIFDEEFPEIEKTGLAYNNESQVQIGEDLIYVPETYFCNPEFFEMFDFKWISGSPDLSLSEPNQVVIDERLERDFFYGDALGKTIKIGNEFEVQVSGIIEEIPSNSDFSIRIAMSYETFVGTRFHHRRYSKNGMSAHQTYVLLKPGTDPENVNARFPDMIARHLGTETAEKYAANYLQPLSGIHFDLGPGDDNFSKRVVSKHNLRNLGLIGILVLFAACINFINLSTANAIKRSKEVGIRKVIGSSRRQLISQFMLETLIITMSAGLLAYLLAIFLMPQLAFILEMPIPVEKLYKWELILPSIVVILLLVVIVGFYPALVVTDFKPISVIKSGSYQVRSGIQFRRSLVVLQIGLSQLLIVCAIVIAMQVYLFDNHDLGFNKEAILTTNIPIGLAEDDAVDKLKNDLLQYPEIEGVSLCLAPPTSFDNKWWTMISHRSRDDRFGLQHKSIDEDYFELYDLELLAGRNVRSTDTIPGIVINETMMGMIGISDPMQALGETIDFWSFKNVAVIGVVKDFANMSLKEKSVGLFFWHRRPMFREISIKINMANATHAISKVEKHWKEAFPEYYFDFSFVDDQMAAFYANERKTVLLVVLFTIIAVFISSLGLFGMVTFMSASRTKEMGIRKVLGAGFTELIYLFSKEFILLLTIAVVIAMPVGYYFMNEWLADFAVRIELSWWIFALSTLAGIMLTVLSIGSKSLQIAKVNPIESLRDE